jgi:hypothetical protein
MLSGWLGGRGQLYWIEAQQTLINPQLLRQVPSDLVEVSVRGVQQVVAFGHDDRLDPKNRTGSITQPARAPSGGVIRPFVNSTNPDIRNRCLDPNVSAGISLDSTWISISGSASAKVDDVYKSFQPLRFHLAGFPEPVRSNA